MKAQDVAQAVSHATNTAQTTTAPSASHEREMYPETAKPGPLEELSQNDDAEVILAPE